MLGENCWWRGKKNFLGFVSKTPPQSCERRLWAPEGLDPGDKDARSSISRVWGTGLPTSPGHLLTVPFLSLSFFSSCFVGLTSCTPCPPPSPVLTANLAWRSRALAPPCERETHLCSWPLQEGRQEGERPGRPDRTARERGRRDESGLGRRTGPRARQSRC